ncbi:hypothetical protein F5Y09DRAFT_295871 [Xylaria sp. FL1042]|nr:hypothetical protein F5Y09DRAFT_295871 [Xylaria sp. FL1042]
MHSLALKICTDLHEKYFGIIVVSCLSLSHIGLAMNCLSLASSLLTPYLPISCATGAINIDLVLFGALEFQLKSNRLTFLACSSSA